MKHIEIHTTVQMVEYGELTDAQRKLVDRAKENTTRSYCPHSHFHVGAALELADGRLIDGVNQENAAFPSGLCAERTALFAAGAIAPDQPIVRLAVACYTHGAFLADPGTPCGGCRQVMVESEERSHCPMEVILYGENYSYVLKSARDLMPLCFDGTVLD